MQNIELSNGLKLPQIGLGTWQITDKDLIKVILSKAYEEGYRLIDTAAAYSNEIVISKAINENGIGRENLLISDKVWNTSRGFESAQEACKKSMKKLKTDYLDLYMIHWPASKKLYSNWAELNADTWRGLEALYEEGWVRAIGVCNFKIHHLEELKKTAKIMPQVNQIEYHPGINQDELLEYCKAERIYLEASSPLGNGQILTNQTLQAIAGDKGKTVSQICLKWALQKGMIVIPKTSNTERLKSNIEIFDFDLSKEEMELIDRIPYCGGIGIDSDEVVEFG